MPSTECDVAAGLDKALSEADTGGGGSGGWDTPLLVKNILGPPIIEVDPIVLELRTFLRVFCRFSEGVPSFRKEKTIL